MRYVGNNYKFIFLGCWEVGAIPQVQYIRLKENHKYNTIKLFKNNAKAK